MHEALQQFHQAAASRLSRTHGLADEIQLRRPPRTEIRFAENAWEQAQQEIARAAQFLRVAIGEEEDHWFCDHSGFQRPKASFKIHASSFWSGSAATNNFIQVGLAALRPSLTLDAVISNENGSGGSAGA
jgi:hypothetical protein